MTDVQFDADEREELTVAFATQLGEGLGRIGGAINRPLDPEYFARQEREQAAYVAAQEVEARRLIRIQSLQVAQAIPCGSHDELIKAAAQIEAFIVNGDQADAVTVQ